MAQLPQYRGQLRQDEIVHRSFFMNKTDGVYLDVGAHDGLDISNTKFFEDIGWKGMCIEPSPSNYTELCKNRPGAITVWGAAYDRDGSVEFRMNTGRTSVLSGIEETYNAKHVKRIEREIQEYGGSTKLVKVPCFTLTSLLQEFNMTEIDFMSLDVEGGEMGVLKGIDFTKIKIKVITIEDNYGDEQAYDALLFPHGYKKLARVQWDIIYYLS